jgi:WD40 repeat protein
LYPAGNNIIIFNTETRVQRIFSVIEQNDTTITALGLSSNKRYLAVGLRADRATIAIYDLQSMKKRKTLFAPEGDTKVVWRLVALISRISLDWLFRRTVVKFWYKRAPRNGICSSGAGKSPSYLPA